MKRRFLESCSVLAKVLFIGSTLAAPIHAAEKVAAEAEVSAVTPPVKLTLQVYKTKLKRHRLTSMPRTVGEPLWVKLGITNV